MRRYIAFLLCVIFITSMTACNSEKGKDSTLSPNNTAAYETDTIENDTATQMYEAAINDEIYVIDDDLGETKLKSLRFQSNDTGLYECKLLMKAMLDVDRDGVGEFLIKNPDNEHIILRYCNGNVHSYRLNGCDHFEFNTDGTFYWYDTSEAEGWECGLNSISFEGESLKVSSIYSIKYSTDPAKYEYFIDGEAVTDREYYDRREQNLSKTPMKFSQFELSCSYPITAEQAWDLANAYWDLQDGCAEVAAGTVFTARIVLSGTPNSEVEHYRFAFQVESASNGGGEGDECKPPYHVTVRDQILVNAYTGEITASTYDPDGKGVSVEEAIEIAKNDCEYIDFANEGDKYRVEHDADADAPDHIYVIVFKKYVADHYSFYTLYWVDKNTGEIVTPYYMWGKG